MIDVLHIALPRKKVRPKNSSPVKCVYILKQYSEVLKNDWSTNQIKLCHCVYRISIFGACSMSFIDLLFFLKGSQIRGTEDEWGVIVQIHSSHFYRKGAQGRALNLVLFLHIIDFETFEFFLCLFLLQIKLGLHYTLLSHILLG